MFRKSSRLAFSLWVVFSVQAALAQVTTGSISGIVRDTTGAVLPGTTITVRHLDTGVSRTLVTDDQGRYHVPNLGLGNYEVQASLAGFQTEVRGGITLTIGREAIVDFTLRVGEITEKVVVIGEAPLVDLTGSSLRELVDDRKIRDLPLNGRDLTQLTFLQTGVIFSRTSTREITTGEGNNISVSGARPTGNLFLLDGTDILDWRQRTPASVSGALTGVETLKEFVVLTNTFSAEFGRATGGVMNAVTKSGTNELHGSAYLFHRNDNLDARNFFDPADPREFKRNQFGFTVGGPIKRNRTFFFGSYEGLRERLGFTNISAVPDEAARQGIIAGRRIGVDPAVRPFLDLYPLPNGQNVGSGIAELIWGFSQPTTEDFFTVRIDHQLSDKDSFFARYTFNDAEKLLSGSLPLFPQTNLSRSQYVTIEEKKIITQKALNLFRFGFNRSTPFVDEAPFEVPQQLIFVPGKRFGIIQVGGLTPLGTDDSNPKIFFQNLFEFSDDFTFVSGAHSVKAGLNIKRFQNNGISESRGRGRYRFRSLSDFLQNRARDFEAIVPGSDIVRHMRQSLFGFYLQDDYRVKSNLTLNLGLRYEFVTEPSETEGKLAVLKTPLDAKPLVGRVFENPSLENFAPRVGFAWDPFSSGKTAIRGGFGIFYDQILPSFYRVTQFRMPPFFVGGRVNRPPFPNAFDLFLRGAAEVRARARSMQFDANQPYIMQYNLNIQREVAANTVLTVGYAGSRGVHLGRNSDGNTAIPTIVNGRKFFPENARRRNPEFDEIRFQFTYANSFYNALLIGVNRRFSRGLQFQASYTLSKTIDEGSNVEGGGVFENGADFSYDPYDPKRDRGLANFDIRHNLVFNYTWDLPFGPGRRFGAGLSGFVAKLLGGWQLNGIAMITSGSPFTVELGFDRDRDQSTTTEGRPDLRPGSSNNPRLGRPERWFDPSAFQLQPEGFYGNLGRNTLISDGLVNFDFSLVKDTFINEGAKVQFRVEFFNLFNHANFALPVGEINGLLVFNDPSGVPVPTAGRVTKTVTTSRQLQFGLKLIF